MAPEPKRTLRCAIYTRKSSEEGLEQEFNTLHAQREACEAFIASQRHEGWQLVRKHYDDGGFSGGSIERPGIQALLQDVQARQVDVVVVYKVDRLTRSLSDFAKMVEVFDANGASFVSVTQQFNTTSSMGRLTLNILLSFAQFEREVTGERIRDKFAASREKGMWMGGTIPLGYDLRDRKLIVNKKEAEQVRGIFETYVRVKCVRKLKSDLEARGIKTKVWKNAAGITRGGRSISRGSLYNLLRNRLYLGEAVHKGKAHPGEHEAVVSHELWNKVQSIFENNNLKQNRRANCTEPSLLSGLVLDEDNNLFSPSHTSRRNRRYRYYVNQAVLQHKKPRSGQISRLPAHELEEAVRKTVAEFLTDGGQLSGALKCELAGRKSIIAAKCKAIGKSIADDNCDDKEGILRSLIERIQVSHHSLEIAVRTLGLAKIINYDLHSQVPRVIQLVAQIPTTFNKSQFKIVEPSNLEGHEVQASLLKSIARAHGWWDELLNNPANTLEALAKRSGVCQRYVSQTLKLVFLNPGFVEKWMSGQSFIPIRVRDLMNSMPINWSMQDRTRFRRH